MRNFTETSLCIEPEIKNEILKAAEITGKSASFLVKRMLSKVAYLDSNYIITDGLTEYQERNQNSNKLILRYRVSDSEHYLFNILKWFIK